MSSDDLNNDIKSEDLSTLDLEGRPEGGIRRKIYIIIFEAETYWGRIFDMVLLWAIVISVVQVILESESFISENFRHTLFYTEWILTIFFTIEYVLRLFVSRKPIRYAKSFFGVVDLLSILPTYLSLLIPGTHYLMVIRALRLLRIFRILKLARFTSAARVLITAMSASRYKIFVFLGVVLSCVLILGTCMYIVEGGEQEGFASIPRSMYWAIVTMTTVGYGDIVPLTTLGKFIASLMMLLGYAIIAVPTGIVTNELVSAERQENELDKPCLACHRHILLEASYCHHCGNKVAF